MTCLPAWRYGAALSITVGLLYLACAVVAMLVPDLIPRILETVVHGLNIRALTALTPSTSVAGVAGGLVYVVLYCFLAGWLFGAVRNGLARSA